MTAIQAPPHEQRIAVGMRSLVEVVARCGPGGRTLLPVVRATGAMAVRRTGEHRIHLVATAFGPLGGDIAVIRLHIEEGARLKVCSVAASVCLPSREPAPSRAELHAEVADGGRLNILLEPTVVAAGAEHHAGTEIALSGEARLRVTERVILGRYGEVPGRWIGTTRLERDGHPVLHTTIELGQGSPMWNWPTTARAYATDLVLDGEAPATARTGPKAVLLPLVGGLVSTAWGERLDQVLAANDNLITTRGGG
ncbi:MAG: urease accessory protein UreD [Geodermatophilaceae bacterium]